MSALDEPVERLSGLLVFPIFRGGLYATYTHDDYLSLSGGLSVQTVPAVAGVASQSYQCEGAMTAPVTPGTMDPCRAIEETFPVVTSAVAGTAYGGLHLTLSDLVLSLRVQAHSMLESAHGPPSRLSGELDVAYRF